MRTPERLPGNPDPQALGDLGQVPPDASPHFLCPFPAPGPSFLGQCSEALTPLLSPPRAKGRSILLSIRFHIPIPMAKSIRSHISFILQICYFFYPYCWEYYRCPLFILPIDPSARLLPCPRPSPHYVLSVSTGNACMHIFFG